MKRAYVQELSKVIYSDNPACFLESLMMSCSKSSHRHFLIDKTYRTSNLDRSGLGIAEVISGQVDSAGNNGFITVDLWKLHFTMFFENIPKKIKYFRSNVRCVHSKQIDIRRLSCTFDLDSCIPATKNI